jgi:hypothetical protein
MKNDYGTEQEARALNGLKEPLKKMRLVRSPKITPIQTGHCM